MAKRKKQQPTLPDEDGYITTGIYSRFVGSSEEHPEEFEKHQQHRRRSIREPVAELFSRLQKGFDEMRRDRKQQIVKDLWAEDELLNETVAGSLLVGYAKNMLAELDEAPPRQLVHYLVQIGGLMERVQIRQFEPLVMSRRRSDAVLEEINNNRPKAEELKREAEDAINTAEAKYATRRGDADFIKKKAAKSLGIGKRALNKRLGK